MDVTEGGGRSSTHRLLIAALVASFVILAAVYSVVTPAWETPDEFWHFAYAAHIRESGTLPVIGITPIPSSQHPPLYYLLVTALSLPVDISRLNSDFELNPQFGYHEGEEDNYALHGSSETFPYENWALALHLSRLASVAMGASTVLLITLTGWLIFAQRPVVGLLAAVLVAYNPQFLFISSAVSPDNLLILAIAGMVWQLTRALRMPERLLNWILIGVWLAVAALAKVNGLLFVSIAGLMLIISAWRVRSWALLFKGGIGMSLPIVAATSWWFIRNYILYGDPLGWRAYIDYAYKILRDKALDFEEVRSFLTIQFTSYWALFGWMNVYPPQWFYSGITVLAVVAIVGLCVFLLRFWSKCARFQQLALLSCGLMVIVHEAYIIRYLPTFGRAWYQGRYLFPLLSPLAILMSLGVLTLTPTRYEKPVSGGIAVAMLAAAIYMPFQVIAPAYDMTPLPKWALRSAQYQTEYQFGGMIALPGYDIRTDEGQVLIDLYWQALQSPDFDYTAFVHVLDEDGAMIAQLDRVPGEPEGFPPRAWAAGDIVADSRAIPLPAVAGSTPVQARVGFYNWETGERLPVSLHGEPAGDSIVIGLPSGD